MKLEIIANTIELLCKRKGISVNEMLKESKAGERTIQNIKAGSKPAIDKIEKIADYFNVSVDYILGRTENPEINK